MLIAASGKLSVLMALLENLRRENHRVLVFSQSRKLLDIVASILSGKRIRHFRIDGNVSSSEDRQRMISRFNVDKSIFCFLLTTQTGGLGITLTGADRVIIFDPAWNPAVDAQACDRVYRIGQKRDVIIYRFISVGTVEEKIYHVWHTDTSAKRS